MSKFEILRSLRVRWNIYEADVTTPRQSTVMISFNKASFREYNPFVRLEEVQKYFDVQGCFGTTYIVRFEKDD